MTVNEEVRVRLRLRRQLLPEGQEVSDMFLLRGDHLGVVLLDDIVKAKLELRMLAEGAKCVWHGPVGVKDGEDVADATLAVSGQFLDAADADLEWCDRLHRWSILMIANS